MVSILLCTFISNLVTAHTVEQSFIQSCSNLTFTHSYTLNRVDEWMNYPKYVRIRASQSPIHADLKDKSGI